MFVGRLIDVRDGGFMKYYFRKPIKRSFGDATLHVFGSAIGWTYKMAFGGLDELSYRRKRKRFMEEIQQSFSSLSLQHGGWTTSDAELPRIIAFDYVTVTVEFKDVCFQITRGRGELSVRASLPIKPQEWQDLSLLWHRKAMRECGGPPSCYEQLGEVAQRLEQNWDQLLAALATWQ
jgi:hypothetical protein